jgi:hypothetical protein
MTSALKSKSLPSEFHGLDSIIDSELNTDRNLFGIEYRYQNIRNDIENSDIKYKIGMVKNYIKKFSIFAAASLCGIIFSLTINNNINESFNSTGISREYHNIRARIENPVKNTDIPKLTEDLQKIKQGREYTDFRNSKNNFVLLFVGFQALTLAASGIYLRKANNHIHHSSPHAKDLYLRALTKYTDAINYAKNNNITLI